MGRALFSTPSRGQRVWNSPASPSSTMEATMEGNGNNWRVIANHTIDVIGYFGE